MIVCQQTNSSSAAAAAAQFQKNTIGHLLIGIEKSKKGTDFWDNSF